jgi:hypothetical protein
VITADDRLRSRLLYLVRSAGDEGALLDDLTLWTGEGALAERLAFHARHLRRVASLLTSLADGGLVLAAEDGELWIRPGCQP